jgi:hypothetical protein
MSDSSRSETNNKALTFASLNMRFGSIFSPPNDAPQVMQRLEPLNYSHDLTSHFVDTLLNRAFYPMTEDKFHGVTFSGLIARKFQVSG